MVRKTIKQGIKAFDFFRHPATFRYGEEPQYQSLTGGIVSIIMIIIFAIIFFNTVLETIRRESIDHKDTTIQQEDPSFYKIGTDSFMFAIGISDFNLNSGERWFDITMQDRTYNGSNRTKKKITLGQCNKSQWIKLKPEMQKTYDKLKFDNWLCPSEGSVLQLQGKFSSDLFKFYKIGVSACTNQSAGADRPCVDSSRINSYIIQNEVFLFNFYFLNTILNPGNQQYISTFLDDTNYFSFSPTKGVSTNFFLSTYSIVTDQSIWPIIQKTQKNGGISDTPTQTQGYEIKQNQYLKFYIRKSSLSINIQRSFRKIDETLSYIGGLFSTIVVLLFAISKYNELSYQMQVAKNLFHYDKNRPLKSDEFNFLVFLGYLIYVFFGMLCINLPWKKMERYQRSLQQVRKQMDIRLVMKKVLYAQRMAIAVFDEPKAKILHLQEPLTLQQAQQLRKEYRFYDKIQNKFFDYKKIRQQQKQNMRQDKIIQQVKKQSEPKNSSDNIMSQINLHFNQDLEEKRKRAISIQNIVVQSTMKNIKQIKSRKSFLDTVEQIMTDNKNQKQKQFNQMLQKIKVYVRILQKEALMGDVVSKKILNRFDPKLMDMFVDKPIHKPEQRQQKIQIFSNLASKNEIDNSKQIIQNRYDESV